MLQVLNPTYTLRVEITDRASGGFSDGISGKTGCDEVLAAVTAALENSSTLKLAGVTSIYVSLERFEHR